MAEYIDRKALEKAMTIAAANGKDKDRRTWDKAICVLHDMPAADVVPVVHGRWEVSTDECFETDVYTCSKCREDYVLVEGTPKENLWNYCPNCGAKMHEDDFCSHGECREGKDEK